MIPKIALDTNAYRALSDGNTGLGAQMRTASSIGLPIIVLGELYYGAYAGSKQEENLLALQRFLRSPRVELLHVDDTTTKLFGEIATELRRLGKSIQQDDMWIAALCKQYGYPLATADKGFSNITGLELVRF